MAERDLLEQVRLDDTYDRLNKILDDIGNVGVFPPLVWVWSWDVAMSTLRDFAEDDEFVVNMDQKQVFDLFWDQADKNGWSLEYGTEDLYEGIRDWMIDQDIVSYKEDLEEDEDE